MRPSTSRDAQEAYREGHEYVICEECGSHILLEDRATWLDHHFEDDPDTSRTISFTCDWEPCEADFDAVVHPPVENPQEEQP